MATKRKRKNKGMAKNKVLALIAIIALVLIAIIIASYSMKENNGGNGAQNQPAGTMDESPEIINSEEAPVPANGGGMETGNAPEMAPIEDMPAVEDPAIETELETEPETAEE